MSGVSGVLRFGDGIGRDPEHIRSLLPVHIYAWLLHQAATTGYLPKLTPEGKPIARDQDEDVEVNLLPAKERMHVIEYLMDKGMPDMKAALPAPPALPPAIDVRNLTPSDIRSMTSSQLAAVAAELAKVTVPKASEVEYQFVADQSI